MATKKISEKKIMHIKNGIMEEKNKKHFLILEIVKQEGFHVSRRDETYFVKEKCPFCKDGKFAIYPHRNVFKCYKCDAKGSAIDFIMKLKDLNFLEAYQYLKMR